MRVIEARQEEGVRRLREPRVMRSGEKVHVIVVRKPDLRRWDLEKLRRNGQHEDAALAEQGLGD